MKTLRYIFGAIVSIFSIGLILDTFDKFYRSGSGFMYVLASILLFIFILLATIKGQKWQGIAVLLLIALAVVYTLVSIVFYHMGKNEFIPIFIVLVPFSLFGLSILQTIKTKAKSINHEKNN